MPAPRPGSRTSTSAQLAAGVTKRPINNLIGLDKYMRSAELLIRQADIYRRTDDERNLYVMLMRLASLVVETIPDHKNYNPNSVPYTALRKQVLSTYMPELEHVKASLDLKDRLGAIGWTPVSHAADTQQLSTSNLPQLDWNAVGQTPAGGPATSESARSPSGQLFDVELLTMPENSYEAAMQQLQNPSPPRPLELGPQQIEVQEMRPPTGPPQPGETCSHLPPAGSGPLEEISAPPPPVMEQPGAIAKQGQGIREVHVSVSLMEEFMRYAISNTKRGIESCGILAGVLDTSEGLFRISTLIIPKQEGTSDTVQALNEEEIFDVQDKRSLYPLGWIHTHPTQTCFLSSIDIHTHCGYQTMLDEAVAIVMAPRDSAKKCGIFRLSTPGGLKLVQKCTQRGFHMHPPTETGQPIYELCGHVYLNPRVKHDVVDLRD
ncbi:hypothetical protein WJX72_001654 [[Myrmecia] bisecta]|uniref:MPN domain-containing protein n=1 Tax=[Myrmecia] bisecta TaxID=41462 RepID=A0AAW1QQF5_9CHLO